MGILPSGAGRLAWSLPKYESICDARLNLLPRAVTETLSTCVDAGAHRGSWSLALLSIFRPKNLIAVECEPRLVEQLAQTLSEWPEVRVVNAALGAREGMATFYQLRHSAGSSLLQPRAEATKEFEEHSWDVVGNAQVRTVSYDEPDEESVSILKLASRASKSKFCPPPVPGCLRRNRSSWKSHSYRITSRTPPSKNFMSL